MTEHTHETRTRSVLKSSTWWTLVFTIDIAIIFFLTKNFEKSIIAVVVTNGVGVAVYFLHERAWSKIFFGLRPHHPTDLD